MSHHRRAVRILDREPVPPQARAGGRAKALRHHSLKPHAAGLPGDGGAVVGGMLAEDDADTPPRQEPRHAFLAVPQWQGAEVLAVELQEVESVQHGIAGGAVAVQSIEDRDAVWTAHDRFAVEGDGAGAQFGSCGGYRRIATAPIVTAAGEKPDRLAVAPDL